MFTFLQQLEAHPHRLAIYDNKGAYTYQQLLDKAHCIAQALLQQNEGKLLHEARVAFQALPTADYVAMLWGIWLAEGIAVPVSLSYPAPEVAYLLQNAEVNYWLINNDYETLKHEVTALHHATVINLESIYLFQKKKENIIPTVQQDTQNALIIYTSGTTGKPKGVVLTHQNLISQIKTLVKAWEWTKDDFTLHTLPLHHIHGIVNVLLCGLWAGACVHFAPKFEVEYVWQCFIKNNYTLYMAVPTIYNRLIESWEKATDIEQQIRRQATQKMRLMVSGSAALPTKTLEKWQEISTHFLLERYGMTEIGMAIANPLHKIRKAGSIGVPLEGVQVRLVDNEQIIHLSETVGELQIKSASVFTAYWQKPEATAESFTTDGWFKTGDIGRRDKDGYYYLLGRESVDILKTGGYKVSALEIEAVLLQHPAIDECAVIGLPDADWGDKVVAIIVWKKEMPALSLVDLREWAKKLLAPYKVPMQIVSLEALPRNAMGKVNKTILKKDSL